MHYATPPRNWNANNLTFRVNWSGPQILMQQLPAVHAYVLNSITSRPDRVGNNQDAFNAAMEFYNEVSVNNYANKIVDDVVQDAMSLGTIRLASSGRYDQIEGILASSADEAMDAHRNAFAFARLGNILSDQGYRAAQQAADAYHALHNLIAREFQQAAAHVDNSNRHGYGGSQNNSAYNQGGNDYGYQQSNQRDQGGYNQNNNRSSSNSVLGVVGGLDSLSYSGGNTSEPPRRTSATEQTSDMLRSFGALTQTTANEPTPVQQQQQQPPRKEAPVNLSQTPPSDATTTPKTVGGTTARQWQAVRANPAFHAAHRSEPIEVNKHLKYESNDVRRLYGEVLGVIEEMSPFDDGYESDKDPTALMTSNVGEALAAMTELLTATPDKVRRRSGWYLRTIGSTTEERDAFYSIRAASESCERYVVCVGKLYASLSEQHQGKAVETGFISLIRWVDTVLADYVSDMLRGVLGVPFTMYRFSEDYESYLKALVDDYGADSDIVKHYQYYCNYLVATLVSPMTAEMDKNFDELTDADAGEGHAFTHMAVPATFTYIPLLPEFFGVGRLRRHQQYVTTRADNPSLYALVKSVNEMVDVVDNFCAVEDYIIFRDGSALRVSNGIGGNADVVSFNRM